VMQGERLFPEKFKISNDQLKGETDAVFVFAFDKELYHEG